LEIHSKYLRHLWIFNTYPTTSSPLSELNANVLEHPSLSEYLSYPSTMIDESLVATVTNLSPADRLELIGIVWDTLSSDDLPVTDAERALLDARLADMESNSDDQSPWP